MNTEEFLEQLRDEVVAADERHLRASRRTGPPTRARSRHRWLGAAAALLLVAGAVVGLRPAPAAAGVEIISDAQGLTIRLTDVQARPEDVEHAAADAGLEVTVVEVPVGPSLVGRFVGLSAVGGTGGIRASEGTPESGYSAIQVPRGSGTRVEVRMGRPARAGEALSVNSDATAPGELLECADLVGMLLAEAVEVAEDAGADPILVNAVDEGRWLSSEDSDDYADVPVVWASAAAGREVRLFVSAERDPVGLDDRATKDPECE